MTRVLVTRPEPGATRTAARLAGLGFEPLVLPLSRTEALAIDPSTVCGDAGAVAVTSANALRHASPELIGRLSHLVCHVVGARTAEAARKAGFTHIEEGPGDAAGLARQIAAGSSGKLTYLCGRVRFSGFEERLAASGVRVEALEVYDTVAIDYDEADVHDRLGGQPVDAVLLYSVTAAHAMRALMRREALRPLFAQADFFALSPRIAAGLGEESAVMVNSAPQPSEPALLALLSRRRGM
ncbi:uroporphyrinogen-III synthase [Aquamicrobium sp.]|uniref:uroporphyrinogen-III synthase n=1 Tax=Aquamicrobium sp. TaxID=1872579 RepID=UPI00258BC746|nr:uroporphyrinogen-III synthase [Aquamicrobium sp.]